MDFSSLSSASLRSIIGLVSKRDSLLADLAKVETAINATLDGGPAAKASPQTAKAPKAKKTRKGKRGALKDKIVAELEAAGKAGVSVKDLAAKLGIKPQNVQVWFYTTGKTVGARRIGKGVFAL